MTEYELYQKIKETISAIEDYKNNQIPKGVWNLDIKKLLPDLIEKSIVLGASGSTCPRCNGSGRI